MRTFDSGATRDSDAGKPDYEGFLSPLVIARFGEYMLKHQVQADGETRASDNWKNGFGENHLDVCMSSLLRHVMDVWLEHEGYPSRDGMEAAINATLFNLMAYQHQRILKERDTSATKALNIRDTMYKHKESTKSCATCRYKNPTAAVEWCRFGDVCYEHGYWEPADE
ncbi:MAG: hypothetical protein JRC93_13630 [Deltaproteobacteria bacterium]|nr:hypothetical protein [Deltaproteobacteria bacterium]